MASYNGIPIYESNAPGDVIHACPVSPYSTLTFPAYWRAINFLANNLSRFTRRVLLKGVEADHPLNKTLERKPNAYQNATQFWRTLYTHAVHHGNGYAEIKRTPTGRPDSLHNLDPSEVFAFRYDDETNGLRQFYMVGTGIARRVLLAADVIHLSGFSLDGQAGLDPTRVHAETFGRAKAQDRHLTRYLMKGTVLRGAIQIPAEVDEKGIAQIQDVIRRYFSGADAERDVMVLPGGATLSNATLTPQQSQLVEQGGYTTKQISQITGVDPSFLFDLSEGQYNNMLEAAGENAVRYTFGPWIDQAKDEYTAKLLTEAEQDAGYTVGLDTEALTRGDTKTITDTTLAKMTGGAISKNEARKAFGLPPDPDPASDKLKTLGDSTPAATPAPNEEPQPEKADASKKLDAYAALAPVVAAAVERITDKTAKAFANASKKTDAERTVWANVYAGQAEGHVSELLRPIDAAARQLGADALNVDAIASRYAAAVRRQAATGEAADLEAIIASIRGNHEQA